MTARIPPSYALFLLLFSRSAVAAVPERVALNFAASGTAITFWATSTLNYRLGQAHQRVPFIPADSAMAQIPATTAMRLYGPAAAALTDVNPGLLLAIGSPDSNTLFLMHANPTPGALVGFRIAHQRHLRPFSMTEEFLAELRRLLNNDDHDAAYALLALHYDKD